MAEISIEQFMGVSAAFWLGVVAIEANPVTASLQLGVSALVKIRV
jgi:hypothetical protein